LVYELSKTEFLTLLGQYPEDYERYCEIRDCSGFKEQLWLI
jgi:hypothetical protein